MRTVSIFKTLHRNALIALLAGLLAAALAPAAQASFGVTENNFEAGTCTEISCKYTSPSGAFFTQAAGHPQWGITTFELNHTAGRLPEGAPLRRLRVDVPPGLAANPQALPTCSPASFAANSCPADSQVGTTELEAVLEAVHGLPVLLPPLSGVVYNLQAPAGLPLEFGINIAPAGALITPVHLLLEGHVDWAGDYHEFFEINNVPREAEAKVLLSTVKAPLTLLKSKLNFNGQAGNGNFLTLPSVCSDSTTSFLEVESYAGEISRTETHTPVGVEGCSGVPFAPSVTVAPETAQSDSPDGATTIVQVPQKAGLGEINTSDIRDAHITLPEGLTLNPPAANGLEACTAAQIAIGSNSPVSCPAGSRIGAVTIETDLPPHTLSGSVFLGSPSGAPITDPPFTIYLDAESPADVSVRLQGSVAPNPATGRLEVSFANNPQLPFSELVLTLDGGARAPLANPLSCGSAPVDYLFTPFTGGPAASGSTPFLTAGCPAPLPFALAQGTVDGSPVAGSSTSYTFNLARADGQQYLAQLSSVLPAGLVGLIPSLTPCAEPQAQTGTCRSESLIGSATAGVGAGAEPYPFTGPVYLTGPYDGAPYGLSIPIDAAVGPFNLGEVVTRAAINVDPHSARIIVSSVLPTIVKGVPLRLRTLSVAINHPGFLLNPTYCGPLSTDSTLFSTFGAAQGVSSPLAVSGCAGLPFNPQFTATTSSLTSKANGAGLQVSLTQPANEANLRSVVVQLPKQLVSRLTTLQKACPEATYAANPFSCPAGSNVGTATVATPVLPTALSGPAYLVSHGGAAFPDLDLLLQGSGVRVVLVGNTNIKGGVTSSTFATIPDVPVSSFALDLPTGPNSALAANGSFCGQTLVMPTTLTAQSGAQVKREVDVTVTGCPPSRARIKILSHRVRGRRLILRVQTFAPGLLKISGKDLRGASKRLSRATRGTTVKLALSRSGSRALRRHKRLRIKVRVQFMPQKKTEIAALASTAVRFHR